MLGGVQPFAEELPEGIWDGEVLDGKYRFERPLASSSMAIVVIARHLELGERVAIKFLSPNAIRTSGALARFRREARAAASIKNQHVVRILDVATTQTSIPYIVMEYLEGMDLERQLGRYPDRKGPISDIVDFVLQAGEAIAEGHQLGIVHRDLKPANLFCLDRGDGYPMIKVLDFGISKVRTAMGDVDRTDQHEILGSPRYMSPEQIDSSRDVDHRTDIWSLGVILYEAIAGVSPFEAETIPELWRRIRTETPRDLKRLRPECPSELIGVVATCLQKEPAKRFSDLGGFATALASVAPERSRASIARIQWAVIPSKTSSTRPSAYAAVECEPAKSVREGRSRRRMIAAGIVAAIMLVLGVGIRLVTRTAPSPTTASHVTASPETQAPRSEPPDMVQVAPTRDTPQVAAASTTTPVPAVSVALPTRSSSRSHRAASSGAVSKSLAPPQPASSTDTANDTSSVEHRRWLVPPVDKRK